MPERIQRRREKGWRMPPGAVYVGRPSRWGNPFIVGERYFVRRWVHNCPSGNAEKAIRLYEQHGEKGRHWIASQDFDIVRDATHAVELFRQWFTYHGYDVMAVDHLRGRDLVCWCPLSDPCHADVLLDLANREAGRWRRI